MPNTNNQYQVGQRVQVKVDGELVEATYAGWNDKYNMPMVNYNGKDIPRKIYGVLSVVPDELVGLSPVSRAEVEEIIAETGRSFSITQRFSFLETLVKLVATATPTSLIITGPGGLGKSYTVFHQLRASGVGMEPDVDFFTIKGFTTPKSLYRTLYENRDKIVVFDDCDSVLKDATAVNILKAALDSSAVRTVSWMTERAGGEGEDSIPNRFDFVGKVIFISNLSLKQVPQALLSRALYVDVSMTSDEKIERIRAICGDVKQDMSMADKHEIVDFIASLKHLIHDLNIRTFLKVCDVRASAGDQWRDIAEYIVTSN